jgi:hypothetical protein
MTAKKTGWWTILLLCLGITVGCGKASMAAREAAPSPSEADGYGYTFDDDGELGAPAPMAERDAALPSEGGGQGAPGQRFGATSAKLAEAAPPAPPPPPGTAPAASPPSGDATRPPGPAPTATDAIAGPLLIYTAELQLGVYQVSQASDAVEAAARAVGGYLVVRDDTTITVRVPAARFDEVLAKVMALGDVLGRNVKVRDVTEEFFDLETRLKNQEAVLARLYALLDRASTVEDALKVEAELARVATEVEQLKGRLKLLRELVTFSTITVTFAPTASERVGSRIDLPFPWLDTLGLGNLLSL